VPTAHMCFELIADGDGRLHVNNQPRFAELELANTDGRYTHPLAGAVGQHQDALVRG
jgi:hypothetical protein